MPAFRGGRRRWIVRAYPIALIAVGVPLALVPLAGRESGQADAVSPSIHREGTTTLSLAAAAAPAPLPRSGWTATADSEETAEQNGRAVNVLDGRLSTTWHTQRSGTTVPSHPHEIIVDTKASQVISGLSYTPRQGSPRNGAIGRYAIYLSGNGTGWGTAVATGTFADSSAVQTVEFAPTAARYVRLRALSEAGDRGPWSSAAEINLLGEPPWFATADREEPSGNGIDIAMSVLDGLSAGTPPRLSALKLSPRRFRAALRGPAVTSRGVTGTTITYVVTAATRTTFTVLRSAPGVRKGARCLAPPRNRQVGARPRACTRTLSIGSFTTDDRAGANKLRFSGWLAGRSLPPGTYTLRAVPRAGAGAAIARRVGFRIIPPEPVPPSPIAPRLRRSGWIATADSEELSSNGIGKARKVLDGSSATTWHTRYTGKNLPAHPHWITIDMRRTRTVSGLAYQPRTSGGLNGGIGRYQIRVSADGTTWGRPVASGVFADSTAEQTVRFNETSARYVRLTALSEAGSRGPWSSAGEINLYGAGPGAATRARKGSWSVTIGFPLVPVAAALLPGNRVLTWSSYTTHDYGGSGKTVTATLDVASRTVTQRTVTETGHDMFCPGISLLPDGRLLVTGGDDATKTSIYTPATNSWSSGPDMNISRGYQSTATMSDGRVFMLGGSWSGGRGGKNGEIFTDGQGWALESGIPVSPILTQDGQGIYRSDNHGWFFAMGGGTIFHAGPSRQMNFFTTGGSGGVIPAGTRGTDGDAMNGTATMYDVGKILTVGGAPSYQDSNATTNAFTIDITGGAGVAPVVRKVGSLASPRAFNNSVVLPDGQVLVVGGQGYPLPFSDATSAMVPELWNPATEQFKTMETMSVPRNYHSFALLLPDARVLAGGGGLCGACATNHADAQIFSPPYLYAADGSPAPRPAIVSAPSTVQAGETIAVTTDRPVSRFSLVRFSSVTHSVNTDQRRIPLSSTARTRHTLTIPADRGTVVPGPYMLFALNNAGIPSVAASITIR